MSVIDQAKAHPYIAGGILIGGFFIAYMLVGGSSTPEGGVPSDSVTSGTALQQYQDQLAFQNNQVASQTQLGMAAIAADVTNKKLEADTAFDIAQLSAGLGYAQIGAARDVSIAGTLAAEKQAQEETKRLDIQTQAATTQQQIMANVINTQTQSQTKVALEAQKPHGLFSFLFG